ncbi:hypothetical protein P4B35_20420 [Pontiellaceae bacterium B12227]|nr:hypothetical protein [Pontiellaceae bacterium B12227]
MKIRTLFSLFSALLIGSHTEAAKLFAVSAVYNGGADSLRVENSSLPDLVKDLIENDGAFSVLQGENAFEANLTYFALPDAFVLAIDRSDPQIIRLRVKSSLISLDRLFEATTEDDLKKQIINWLYLEGSQDAADLLRIAIQSSAAVITDGSPASTTAQLTDGTFHMFGMYQSAGHETGMRGAESGAHFAIWYNQQNYTIESPIGDLQGARSRIIIPLWLHFNSRISLVAATKFDLNEIEGTDFYGLGADIGMAFRPVVRSGDDRFGWQFTPVIGAYGIGSADGVTAAIISQAGLINRFEWRVFDRSLLSLVSQYTSFENLRINLGDVELATPIDQNILKNGIMYEFPVFSKSLYGNAHFIDSRFLKDSRVKNFQTYGVGLAYRLTRFSLQANLGYDHADLYSGTSFNLGAVWDL